MEARLGKASSKALTFDQAAERFLKSKLKEFDNAKHSYQWLRTLEMFASPIFGKKLVSDIELADIVNALEPIRHEKTETATRVRGRIEAVSTWATVSGFRTGENPARWRGNLDAVLPKPSRITKVRHYRAVSVGEVANFMTALRKRPGMAARALEFAILTAARSGEVRWALWSEVDLKTGVWTIPADRMKARKEHRVPLSDAAVRVLKALPNEDDVLFPAPRGGAFSDMALSALMRRMKVDAVPHGFRSTFRDWGAEHTNYPREVAEEALAHQLLDKVEAAYRRGDLLEKRRAMMNDWAEWCDGKN